jgi:membrane associated rhomboid family serine protease
MFPIRDNWFSRETPVITYTLIGLNIFLYLWDRGWNLFGPSMVFADLAMRPREVVEAALGQASPGALATLFTAMFLHASLLHLVGNLIFLLTFGDNVEHALGGPRFALYYLFWGLMAWAAHILVQPASPIPTLGASGAIGGVLGAYFLLFPANRVKFVVFPFLFWPVVVAAWVLLGLWFLFQIAFPQQGVANWAHAGGFLAGMLTVLILGGRQKVLRNVRFEQDLDPDFA